MLPLLKKCKELYLICTYQQHKSKFIEYCNIYTKITTDISCNQKNGPRRIQFDLIKYILKLCSTPTAALVALNGQLAQISTECIQHPLYSMYL